MRYHVKSGWNPYENRLIGRINRIYPGAFRRLSDIWTLPEDRAEDILGEILKTGCLSQNCANIEAARRAFSRLPPAWAAARFPKAASACLFREPEWQEWEFRRAAEMLGERFPDTLAWLIEYGKCLNNPEVDEAAADISELSE